MRLAALLGLLLIIALVEIRLSATEHGGVHGTRSRCCGASNSLGASAVREIAGDCGNRIPARQIVRHALMLTSSHRWSWLRWRK